VAAAKYHYCLALSTHITTSSLWLLARGRCVAYLIVYLTLPSDEYMLAVPPLHHITVPVCRAM